MSNLGQAALIVVGTVVGAYFGNPELGFALGSVAGGVLFPTQLPAGPQLTDNRTTTATVGVPVPIVFGTANVSGTVIWLAPYITNSTEVGGKGGPEQQTYSYLQSIAIGLCEAAIDGETALGGISRIWENGTIVYDIRPQLAADTFTGQPAEADSDYANRLQASAAYALTFTFYPGSETQTADPTIEATEGVGNVPAFRGLAYIVYPNRVLSEDQGFRHPNFTFEVYAHGTGNCTTTTQYSNTVLYPWGNGDGTVDPTNMNNANTWTIGTMAPQAPGYDIGAWGNPHTSLESALAVAAEQYGFAMDVFIGYALPYDGGGGSSLSMAGGGNPDGGGGQDVSIAGQYLMPDPGMIQAYYGFTPVNLVSNNRDPSSVYTTEEGQKYFWDGNIYETLGPKPGSGVPDAVTPYFQSGQIGDGFSNYWQNTTILAMNVVRNPAAPPDPCAGLQTWSQNSNYCVSDEGFLILKASWTAAPTDNGYYKVLQSFGSSAGGDQWLAQDRYPLNPCLPPGSPNDTETFWTAAYEAAVATGAMSTGKVYPTDYPVTALENIWQIDYTTCTGLGAAASVADIISAVCARAGVDDIDVSALEDVFVLGYAISSLSNAVDIITPLQSIGFFDACESGTTLKFVVRGGAIVRTLTTDDFGCYDASTGNDATVPPSVTTVRTQDVDLPRQIRLHYPAVTRDYQAGEQDSPFRLTTSAVNDLDVNLPMVIGDTQALQAADVCWQDAWTGRTSYTIVVDQSLSELEVTDVIAVPVDSFYQRVRITTEKNAGAVLRTLTLVLDDDASYVSTRVAAPVGYVAPMLTLLAQTQAEFLDLPCLQDSDNDAGFYIAAQRDPTTGNDWKGCTVYQSVDEGATWNIIETMTNEATIGSLNGAVPSSQAYTWDDETEIVVNVASSAFTFESRTDAAVIAGANAAAMGSDGRWEIVQFANAEQLSATQWKLTRLLRGRRGTEHNIGKSQYGDSFVMISTGGIVRVTQSTASIGTSRMYKFISIGAAYALGIDETFAGHGESLVPFSPVDLEAISQSNGDILISWKRRDRLGRTLMSGTDIPMSEATLQFTVEIADNTSPASPVEIVRTATVTSNSYLYTGAQQRADFTSFPLTELKVAIAQVSAVVGNGTRAIETLEVRGTEGQSPATPGATHSILTLTVGGAWTSTDVYEVLTVSVVYTPNSGSSIAHVFTIDGTGFTGPADFATAFYTAATSVYGGVATVTKPSVDVVKLDTISGTFTGEYFTNSPVANVTRQRNATATQTPLSSIWYVDLWNTTTGVLSPTTDPVYNADSLCTMALTVHAYDFEIESALSEIQQPPIPTGLEEAEAYVTGYTATVSYSMAGGTGYFNAIYNLAAAINASTALAAYVITATPGQLTGTSPGTMARPAISITMKPGYYLAQTTSAHPTGFGQEVNLLSNGRATYASPGAAQVDFVEFDDAFNSQTGAYYSEVEIGQVYWITIDGATYYHTADSTDVSDPRTDGGSAYYRDAIYEDFTSQIEGAGYTVVQNKFYRVPGGPATWISAIQVTGSTGNVSYGVTAGVLYDLTADLTITS